MKFISVFIDVFCIFALLTLGSLMMMVAFHILPMEDALIQIQAIYDSAGQSFQLGLTGSLFIFSGLMLSKTLLKKTRKDDDFFIVDGETGRLTVYYATLNDLVGRILKRFEEVRFKSASSLQSRDGLKIEIEAEAVTSTDLSGLSGRIQRDVGERVIKLLGQKIPVVISVHFTKITGTVLD